MDLSTKLGTIIALLGLSLGIIPLFIAEELKNAPRWFRFTLAGVAVCLIFIGAGMVAFWPTPVLGNGPRMEVTRAQWVQRPDGEIFENIFLTSTGDRPARSMVRQGMVFFQTTALSSTQEDDVFKSLRENIIKPDKNGTREVAPGDKSNWFTLFNRLPAQKIIATVSAPGVITVPSPGAIYSVALMQYVDSATGNIVETEYCTIDQDGATHWCNGHNRIGPPISPSL